MAGEELTISYNQVFLKDPVSVRRKYLLREQEFLCKCVRCSDWDDTRRFSCPCGGHHFAANGSQTLSPCIRCSGTLSTQECTRRLGAESKLQRMLDALPDPHEQVESTCGSWGILRSLAPLHPHHHMSLKISDMERRYAESDGDVVSLIRAHHRLAEASVVLLPSDLSTAWRIAQLGEVLSCAGQLQNAADAYRNAFQLLCKLQLPDEPYPRRCGRQLLSVLKRLDDSEATDACALCHRASELQWPCEKCRRTWYCCASHRLLHQRLHRRSCSSKSPP